MLMFSFTHSIHGFMDSWISLQAYVSESVRSAEEEEFCGNVFDALSSALLLSDNRPLLAADAAAMPTLIGLLRYVGGVGVALMWPLLVHDA